MLRLKLFICLISILSWPLSSECRPSPQVDQRHRNIKLAESLFGPEIEEQLCLFEINKDYALRIKFDRFGDISSVSVTPKFHLREFKTEWSEPDYTVGMSGKEFKEVFLKINRLKDMGSSVSRGKVGVVTNSKLWLWDQYHQAFVRRVLNVENSVDEPDSISSFSIYYIRRVEGRVEGKQPMGLSNSNKRPALQIDGCWYATTEQQFDMTEIDKHASVYAAGPINDSDECL